MTRMVIKATSGADNAESCVMAFTVASTAVASGHDVSLWLTGEATLFAIPGTEDLTIPHSLPLSTLRDVVLDGGSITVCGQCAERRNITGEDLLPGIRLAGAASFVEEVAAGDARVLVY